MQGMDNSSLDRVQRTNAASREWRKANPEKAREISRRSRIKNQDRNKAQQAAWYARNHAQILARRRAGKYGTDGIDLLIEQRGKCAICKCQLVANGKDKHAAQLDHDHTTGKVRGWLCRGCNWGLGHFQDDADRLKSAADYLSRG